jgi:hypothetical protein
VFRQVVSDLVTGFLKRRSARRRRRLRRGAHGEGARRGGERSEGEGRGDLRPRADAGNYRAAGETGELVLDGRGERIRGS